MFLVTSDCLAAGDQGNGYQAHQVLQLPASAPKGITLSPNQPLNRLARCFSE
jgi:hypothetical protein